MKGAEVFNFKFFCLMLITLFILNCTYTILEHRYNESIEIIKEQTESIDVVYPPPVIIEPVKPMPQPPPIRPGPPIKPDPIIEDPIKEVTQPIKEDSFKKRLIDKRKDSNLIEDRNSLKRKRN
jgi:hypothetical protein